MKILGKHFPYYRLRALFFRAAGYEIGEKVYLGEDLIIVDELTERNTVKIAHRASIAERVTLVTVSNPNFSRIFNFAPTSKGPIVIDQDAWIGTGAIILPAIKVGEGAVVGAGSVVIQDVPPYTIVAGVPAKILRKINLPEMENTEGETQEKTPLKVAETGST